MKAAARLGARLRIDPESRRRDPHEVAAELVADAPDQGWLRVLVDDLDRHVRTAPLERLLALWRVSAAEAARMFGVSRQAFAKWLRSGPPSERATSIAALAAATDLLDCHIKRERIAAVVRRRAVRLKGRSLYELACAGEHAKVRAAVEAMFDLRGVQP